MKRAEVFRVRRLSRRHLEAWRVAVHEGDIPERHRRIWDREPNVHETPHPTHAAALAHALHEVGLTPTSPEEEN